MSNILEPMDSNHMNVESVPLIAPASPTVILNTASMLGTLLSWILILLTVAGVTLGWILYVRDQSSFLLLFAIASTVAAVFSLLFFFIRLRNIMPSTNYLDQNYIENRSHILQISFSAFYLTALVLSIYFMVICVAIFLYKPIFFSRMKSTYSNKERWDKTWNKELDVAWNIESKFLTAIGFISFFTSMCLIVVLISFYERVRSKFALKMSALFLTLVFSMVFLGSSFKEYMFISTMEQNSSSGLHNTYMSTLLGLLVAGMILMLLNACAALFMKRGVLVIFGGLLAVFAFFSLVVLVIQLSKFDVESRRDSLELGKEVQQGLKEDVVASYCGSKFAATTTLRPSNDTATAVTATATTAHLQVSGASPAAVQNSTTVVIESTSRPALTQEVVVSVLNANCFEATANFYLYRYLRFFILASSGAIFAFAASGYNFALAREKDEHGAPPLFFAFINFMANMSR